MNPRVKEVKPLSDYKIELVFSNQEVRIFDVAPYLKFGIFQELSNRSIFNSVHAVMGTVQWKNGQDFCPDMLYEESVPVNNI